MPLHHLPSEQMRQQPVSGKMNVAALLLLEQGQHDDCALLAGTISMTATKTSTKCPAVVILLQGCTRPYTKAENDRHIR